VWGPMDEFISVLLSLCSPWLLLSFFFPFPTSTFSACSERCCIFQISGLFSKKKMEKWKKEKKHHFFAWTRQKHASSTAPLSLFPPLSLGRPLRKKTPCFFLSLRYCSINVFVLFLYFCYGTWSGLLFLLFYIH